MEAALPPVVKNIRQLAAAGVGGAVGTGLDIAVLVLLVEHGARVAVAAFCGAAAGALVNFTLNKYVAFRDRSRITARQLARFGLVTVATAMLMAGAMQLVAVELGVPYLVAKLICAAIVFAVWTYPAQRRLVFRRPAHAV
jgi:putative flippase GtrA